MCALRKVIACMVSLRSKLVPRLSVIFNIREKFLKFPHDTKFPENYNRTTRLVLEKLKMLHVQYAHRSQAVSFKYDICTVNIYVHIA